MRHESSLGYPVSWAILTVALFGGMLSSCRSAPDRSAKLPVRLVMSSQVYTQLPVVLAQGLRYYDEEGLTVQIENVQSNTKAVHALVGGSADVSTGTFGQVLSVASEGRDVKAFVTMLLGSQVVMVASPGIGKKIRTIRDLRGATIGVGGLGGPANQFLNWVLKRHGLSPADVTTVTIGTLATAVSAVEHGKVTAAVLNEVEYLMLRKRGLAPLLLVDTRGRENTKRSFGTEKYCTSVLIATEPWLRQHAETARRLARAINRTMRWMHQQSPTSVVHEIPAAYRSDRDLELAAVSTVLPMFSEDGRMPAEGAEAVKRVLSLSIESIRNGNVDLKKAYTNEIVEEHSDRTY